ncbi:MAG: aminotransferase class I/II-fold pyridoxal phosphate-dependent enzyme [Clostridiales Family XIII bacterium]|jgi:LL-diaminopimelate aminotransferase|nr:aminotransferase class I/II-fold pyridoxal phosphate-dependent enzyme [Clostridiales Family XIII bacterium]
MYLSKLVSEGSQSSAAISGKGGPVSLAYLEERRLARAAKGLETINLSAGTPDRAPADHVIEAAVKAAADPKNYKYAIVNFPETIDAVIGWYSRRFGVELEKDQILSAAGSQEGISTVFQALCDPGDTVIVPAPCYPIFAYAPLLAGCKVYRAVMRPENDFLIDFDDIPEDVAKKARVIILSYPCNPVGAVATPEFYTNLVSWAKKYDVAVIHDAAYAELVHEGEPAASFLATPGAMDVGIEFNSLSKSYNLTGLRISFCVGNRDLIRGFAKLRAEIDYGMPGVHQAVVAAALNGPQDLVALNRRTYTERRDVFVRDLRQAGWDVPKTAATMFTWFPIPGDMGSGEFCERLIEEAGVVGVPGVNFGPEGEGWIRFALVQPAEALRRAAELIAQSGIIG